MSDEHDRSSDVIRIGANPAGTPDREAMWAVISESWDAQKARRDRLRVAEAVGGKLNLLGRLFSLKQPSDERRENNRTGRDREAPRPG